MKNLILIPFTIFLSLIVYSQKPGDILKEKAGEGVRQGAEIATEHTADKVADKILGGLFGKKNKNKKQKGKDVSTTNQNNTTGEKMLSTSTSFHTYSKYDFVPGDKVVAYEDFSQDHIGDFPDKWTTNSSGEVVTIDGQSGHWLELRKPGIFIPEFIKSLPDNFTLQFDLMVNPDFHGYSNRLQLFIIDGDNGKRDFDGTYFFQTTRSGVLFSFWPADASPNPSKTEIKFNNFENGKQMLHNQTTSDQFAATGGKNIVKVAIWRQKERIRMYLNQDKIIDAPRALLPGKKLSKYCFLDRCSS